MKKLILILFFILNICSFAQERDLVIRFDESLWRTQIFRRHYPDWPQISVVKVDYQNGCIYYTSFNSFKKQMILLPEENPVEIFNNPNFLKSKILNISPQNSLVQAYWGN